MIYIFKIKYYFVQFSELYIFLCLFENYLICKYYNIYRVLAVDNNVKIVQGKFYNICVHIVLYQINIFRRNNKSRKQIYVR